MYACIDACMFICMRSRSAHSTAFPRYELYLVHIPHAQCITELVPQTRNTTQHSVSGNTSQDAKKY